MFTIIMRMKMITNDNNCDSIQNHKYTTRVLNPFIFHCILFIFLFTESQQFYYYYDFIINLRTYSQYNIVIHSLLFGWTTQTVCVCGFVCIHNLQNIQWIQLIKLWLVREKIVVGCTCTIHVWIHFLNHQQSNNNV